MNWLIACEESATVRDEFRKRGHNAWSCDILPCSGDPRWHLKCDVLSVLHSVPAECNHGVPAKWDGMIAFPPCTYLALCQVWRCNKSPERAKKREAAVRFARTIWSAPIPLIGLEQPKSQLSTMMAPKSQTIHPWQFGHKETKETWLWLKGLPPLRPTNIVGPPPPKDSPERKDWERVWRMPPSPARSRMRSKTYPGIAEAMADQWGGLQGD